MARYPYENQGPYGEGGEPSLVNLDDDDYLEDLSPAIPVSAPVPRPSSVPPPTYPPPAGSARAPSSLPPPPAVPPGVSAPFPGSSAPAASAPSVTYRTAPPTPGADSLSPVSGLGENMGRSTRPTTKGRHVGVKPATKRRTAVSGFAWGAGLMAVLAGVGVFYLLGAQSGGAAASSSAPVVLDADAIRPVKKDPLIDRVRRGEKDAIAEFNAREPTSLTPEEVQALAIGEEKVARQKASRAVGEIAKKKTFSEKDKAEFLRYAGNPRTYREALVAMAKHESWQGPDMIYQAMRRYRLEDEIRDFALSVLLTPQVYKYASPALSVVIDAEAASECEEVRALLERVSEDGDTRAVRHMARFAKTTGCGEHENEDCYPCLRTDRAFVDALRAAQGRRPPI